jgi:hypothetical protein
MGTNIPSDIRCLQGRRVNQIKPNPDINQIVIHCSHDRRRKAIGPVTGQQRTVNQYVRRLVTDLPLFGHTCVLDIEWRKYGSAKFSSTQTRSLR